MLQVNRKRSFLKGNHNKDQIKSKINSDPKTIVYRDLKVYDFKRLHPESHNKWINCDVKIFWKN